MFQKPWAGQLILCLTVKFACFLIFSSLPTFCQPASRTTAFRTLSNYTKSLTQSQSHKLSEDQHKLAAEMTLRALFIMYMCVYLRSWVALLLAGSSVRDLQLKAILPARLSVRSVSVATVAFRKPSQNEKNKSSAAQKKIPPKIGYKILFKRLDSVHAAYKEDNSNHQSLKIGFADTEWGSGRENKREREPEKSTLLGFSSRTRLCKYCM